MQDEDGWNRLGLCDDSLGEFFSYCRSEGEIRQMIAHLVEHRALMRDEQLERLEAESANLLIELQTVTRQKLIEELQCFKDVLALHKRLLEANGAPRD